MMIKLLLILITVTTTQAFSGTPEMKPARPLTAKPAEKWKIRWDRSDDFGGEHVDWTKWFKKPENFGAWTWDNDANVSVSDGFLKITMRNTALKKNGNPNFTSGMLKSYRKGCYGYYEARIKAAPMFPGVCPAFWIYSSIDDSKRKKGALRYCEVDIVEMTQRGDHHPDNEKITDHNLHAILSNGKKGVQGREWRRPHNPMYSAAQASEYRAPFDPRDGFHVYGCMVSKERIIWYVDGIEVGRKPNELWHSPMNVALSLGLRSPFAVFRNNRLVPNDDAGSDEFPTSMLVDYVRVWDATLNK